MHERTGFEMMDRDSYIAHMMFKKRKTEQQAIELYDADMANHDIFKKQHQGKTYIAVELNMRIEIGRSIRKQREITASEQQLKTDREKTAGVKRALDVLEHGTDAPIFNSLNAGVFHSGQPGGIEDFEKQKALRDREDQSAEAMMAVVPLDSPGVGVQLDFASMSATEKALTSQKRNLDRQHVCFQYEQVKIEAVTLSKRLQAKFAPKILEKLDPEHRQDGLKYPEASPNLLSVPALVHSTPLGLIASLGELPATPSYFSVLTSSHGRGSSGTNLIRVFS